MERMRVTILTLALVVSALLGAITAAQVVGAEGLDTATWKGPVFYQDETTAGAVDGEVNPDGVTIGPADDLTADTPVVAPVATEGQPPVLDQPVPVDPNIFMWQTVLGVVSSLATSFISRGIPGDTDDSRLKRGLALGAVVVVFAVFDVFVRGVFNPSNYLASFLTIAVTAIGFYKGWSATSGLARKIEGRG